MAGPWTTLGRWAASGCLALATPVLAAPGATLVAITRDDAHCAFDVVFHTDDAAPYAVNVWDDGTFLAGAGDDFPADATVTMRVTIGARTLANAPGLGVYVEDVAGQDATTVYDANVAFQYPDELGDGCEGLGFAFAVALVSVVEPTTTTTSTTSTTTSSLPSTTTTSPPLSTTTTVAAASPTSTTLGTTPTSTTSTTLPGDLLAGSRLLLRASRLALRSAEGRVGLGDGPGGADDPTRVGGSLRIRGAGFERTFHLPARAWRPLSTQQPDAGYRMRGAAPVQTVVVRARRGVEIAAQGLALDVPLAADVRPVQVELRLGGHRYCFEFGGRVRWRPGKRWLATGARAPAACPP